MADTETATTERQPLQVGDVFCASWGYDQTNIDFYEVVKVTATGVRLEAINSRVVQVGPGTMDQVEPVLGTGDPTKAFFRKVDAYRGNFHVNINSYASAYRLVDDRKIYQTGFGYGH